MFIDLGAANFGVYNTFQNLAFFLRNQGFASLSEYSDVELFLFLLKTA